VRVTSVQRRQAEEQPYPVAMEKRLTETGEMKGYSRRPRAVCV